MISALNDRTAFRSRRERAWRRNINYWLIGPLRHVQDVGEYIVQRTVDLCRDSSRRRPRVVDMGFGNAWLLRALRTSGISFEYVGLDVTATFVERAREEFSGIRGVRFEQADFEIASDLRLSADVVVNAFNFFELCDLDVAMYNAATFLRRGGTLLASTIDKTYLILALSKDWGELLANLRLYETLTDVKYAFQPIDLGSDVSSDLEYPSVLYSTDDFLTAASRHQMVLRAYREHAFTAKLVPKIYCHFEFQKTRIGSAVRRAHVSP